MVRFQGGWGSVLLATMRLDRLLYFSECFCQNPSCVSLSPSLYLIDRSLGQPLIFAMQHLSDRSADYDYYLYLTNLEGGSVFGRWLRSVANPHLTGSGNLARPGYPKTKFLLQIPSRQQKFRLTSLELRVNLSRLSFFLAFSQLIANYCLLLVYYSKFFEF